MIEIIKSSSTNPSGVSNNKNEEKCQPSSTASKRKLEARHDFDKALNMSSQDIKKICLEKPTKINDDHCSEAQNKGNSYIPVTGYRLADMEILNNTIKNAHKCVKG